MTHRDILRRDIDEVLSKISSYRHFFEYLENLRCEVRGNEDSPNLSIIAEGWQRLVRLKSLGPKYTPDAIKERLLRNLDNRDLYWIAIPERTRAPLLIIEYHLRQTGKMDGLQLTFAIFTELLKICTGNNLLAENKHLPLSPLLRKQQRIAKRIAERSAPKVENLLTMEQQETEVTKGIEIPTMKPLADKAASQEATEE